MTTFERSKNIKRSLNDSGSATNSGDVEEKPPLPLTVSARRAFLRGLPFRDGFEESIQRIRDARQRGRPGEEMELALLDELLWCHIADVDGSLSSIKTGLEAVVRERWKQRTGWPMRVDDATIAAARDVVRFVCQVVLTGGPGCEKLQLAATVLRDPGIQARRRSVLHHIESALVDRDTAYQGLTIFTLPSLLAVDDERYRRLDSATIKHEFSKRRRKATRVAAALSVACKAFGDDDESKSYKAFREAKNSRE